MSSIKRITWYEIEDVAKEAFDVCRGNPDLRWASMAWEVLESAGATIYTTGIAQTEVKIKFLALAGIYRDFCHVVWHQCCEPDYYD